MLKNLIGTYSKYFEVVFGFKIVSTKGMIIAKPKSSKKIIKREKK
tara:strand:+ start:158 stop:292 length:135 start_codon:yes stop_codon:yes gene_type:complete